MTADGWSHLGNHIYLAFSSTYAQVIGCGLLFQMVLVGFQLVWRLFLQRHYYSEFVPQKNIVNTQIGYKRSISGMIVYYLWCAFTIFLFLTDMLTIMVVLVRPTGPGFVLSIQKAMFKCSDGGALGSELNKGDSILDSFLEGDHVRDRKTEFSVSSTDPPSQAIISSWLSRSNVFSTDYPSSNVQAKSMMQDCHSNMQKKAHGILGTSHGNHNSLSSQNLNHQFSALEVSMDFRNRFAMGVSDKVSMTDDWSQWDDFSWPCLGYEMYKPAAVNGKLQIGIAFIGYWFLFIALMAGFYVLDLYVLLVYVEVKDLAIADIIGFSEDLVEEIEGQVHGGTGSLAANDVNAGNDGNSQPLLGGPSSSLNTPPSERKTKKQTVDQLLRAKNMQPISYREVRINTQARANLYKEVMRILEPPKANGDREERRESEASPKPRAQSEGDAYGANAETEGSIAVHGQTNVAQLDGQSAKEDTVSRYFVCRCLRFTYNSESGRFMPDKNRLEDFSANDVINQFFDTQGRMNAAKEKRIGLSTLSYRQISILQQYFGKNRVEADERMTFLGFFWAEVARSFFYVFQVALILVFIFLEAIFEAVFYQGLFLFTAFVGVYYVHVSWNKILEVSRTASRVKVLRRKSVRRRKR